MARRERDRAGAAAPLRGAAAAVAGTLAGSGLVGGMGAAIGWIFANTALEDAELEKLLPFVFGLAAGAWAGGVAGCFLAMRLTGHPAARTTARVLAVAFPLAVALALVLIPAGLDLRAGLLAALVLAPLLSYALAARRA